MEYKQTPVYTKSISGRTVTGVFAIHGNVDGGGDRSWPGAFTKTMQEGAKRIRFLWMHDMYSPPIATIKSMREVGRGELPPDLLSKHPEVTGGAEVVREYLTTERGDEILTGIVAGAINEMSYGYDVLRYDQSQADDGKSVRELREVRLWDISDVNFGLNELTVGSKFYMSAELLFAQLQAFAAEYKAGRRNNSDDQSRIDLMHAIAVELGASNCAGILTPDDTEKSRAVPPGDTHSDAVDVGQLFAVYQRNIARLMGVAIGE